MKILSIDTSSNVCSVAILDNLNIIYEKSINDGLTHSQNLMPLIDEAFNNSNISLSNIDLFTCSIGPGSFTGIRIGVASIKAFVDVYSKPSIGISSLEGLAYNLDSEFICSIIDAKHDNIYCRLFQKKSDSNYYIPVTDYISSDINSCLSELAKYSDIEISFIGDGACLHKKAIQNLFKKCNFSDESINLQKASSIGKAAYYRFTNKLECPALSPLYLKKSQAELALNENKK